MDTDFKIKDFAISTQKKFASKLAQNAIIRNSLVDDSTTEIFNLINKIIKLYINDKKKSEKTMRDIIKIIVKLGVLQHNDRLETRLVTQVNSKLRHVVLTMISFHEVQFTFDKKLAVEKMKTVQSTIHLLLKSGKVKEKTHGRLDNIMELLADGDFLHALYHDPKFESYKTNLAGLLNKAVEEGRI